MALLALNGLLFKPFTPDLTERLTRLDARGRADWIRAVVALANTTMRVSFSAKKTKLDQIEALNAAQEVATFDLREALIQALRMLGEAEQELSAARKELDAYRAKFGALTQG